MKFNQNAYTSNINVFNNNVLPQIHDNISICITIHSEPNIPNIYRMHGSTDWTQTNCQLYSCCQL